jgi:flagellar hook protein FlgE
VATPTTTGTFSGNLDASAAVAPVAPATLPSGNLATATTNTQKSSIVGYDKLGNAVTYDVYFTKTAAANSTTTPATSGTWEVAVFRAADAATGGTSSFPYTSAAVATSTLTFSSTGALLTGGAFTITDPTTGGSIAMDMTSLQQLGTTFSGTGEMNGQAASKVTGVTVNSSGLVSANYANSTSKILYQVPLATVSSPDKLTLESGNVYTANGESGVTVTGWANSAGLGSIVSNSLEKSNVDLANQLTDMIEAQKSYTANSKVFQTGSELMDVLDQLVR